MCPCSIQSFAGTTIAASMQISFSHQIGLPKVFGPKFLQATVFGTWRICSYDLNGQEDSKTNEQESAAYPYQQAEVDLCESFEVGGQREYNLV